LLLNEIYLLIVKLSNTMSEKLPIISWVNRIVMPVDKLKP